MYNLRNNCSKELVIDDINKEFQIYFFLTIILISLQLICNIIEPIIVTFRNFRMPASAIFYVFSFAISDILTENFGFKLAVRATVFNIISQFIYCGIALIVLLLPNKFKISEADNNFHYIFHFLSMELFGSILALLISKITNDYIINILKLRFLGHGFWWRTIVSTIIGEIVMLNIDYNLTFLRKKNLIEIQQLIFDAMSYKIIAACILSYPTTILSNYISRHVYILKPNLNQKPHLLTDLKNAIFF